MDDLSQTRPVDKSSSYIPEFDALRALAALGVMAAHYQPFHGVWGLGRLERRLGPVCVDLFFALSGYLITGILLNCRNLNQRQTVTKTLRQFYARRLLRIFPLYYVAFAIFALFVPAVRQNAVWFLTYTVNFGKAYSESLFPLNHFWTLAVEEQFYIVWPLIVLLSPGRALVPLCIAGAGFSFVTRIALHLNGAGYFAIAQFTPSCLEPLLLGAAFASAGLKTPSLWFWMVHGISGVLAILVFVFADAHVFLVCSRALFGVFFATVVFLVAWLSGCPSLRFLRYPPILYAGQISYGLYVWHLPVMWAIREDPAQTPTWVPGSMNGPFDFLLMVVLTFVVSTFSWHLLERPLNSLKSRFPYHVV